MTIKDTAISTVDQVNAALSRSPIVKGLIDGGISLIPFLGQAITSALDTRAFQLFEQNSKCFSEDVKELVRKLDQNMLDRRFIESAEFVSILTDILARNARTHEEAKIRLYATLFVNFTKLGKSATPYKEGFIRIIDELSVEHIQVLAVINKQDMASVAGDTKQSGSHALSQEIAKEMGIPEARVQAYCDQMTRFGLLRDAAIGHYDYKPGSYAITDYGREFVGLLEKQAS